ncbi:conserved hypothetical protein [Flavobacterium sp. 9R]|uniref:hypothetical protein n=1 Tax=Flavobacterium sp. 9R TaxID=2653143 RepID=UPI0012F46CCF|nr:hypothetical protein [Flavobacterium sp. 9R]VXC07951.1 conserved hypothetical protein [Flavobacterium sp. 9R]
MKKVIVTLALLAFFGITSCKKEAKLEESTADTTAVAVDSSKAEAMVDPDPTDTIPAGSYGINSSSLKTADLIRLTLKDLYKDDLAKNFIDDNSKKFIFFEYDLNEDGKKEILVGLTGGYFCGTGGCTQLLLDDQGNVITQFSVSGNPVVIDTNKTNGWKDLFIYSGSKYRIVKFNGKTYPSNPSMQPELKVTPGDGLPRALDFEHEPYAWFKF